MLKSVSYILIFIRFMLAPLLFYDAYDGQTGIWFLMGLAFGFLSDIFDGVIARSLHVVTAHLREIDGQVDVWFFIWIAASAWQTHPETVITYRFPLLAVFCLQVLSWIMDWLKYRRFSNYHAYSAKAFGLSIFAATMMWFSYGPSEFLMWCVSTAGIICMVEEIAITLLLPTWTYDVPSLFHALRIKADLTSPTTQKF